jgi:hypothetical protein
MAVTKELWRELCRQAAIEKDPNKLVKLYDEINSILQRASNAGDQNSANEQSTGTNGRPA